MALKSIIIFKTIKESITFIKQNWDALKKKKEASKNKKVVLKIITKQKFELKCRKKKISKKTKMRPK